MYSVVGRSRITKYVFFESYCFSDLFEGSLTAVVGNIWILSHCSIYCYSWKKEAGGEEIQEAKLACCPIVVVQLCGHIFLLNYLFVLFKSICCMSLES